MNQMHEPDLFYDDMVSSVAELREALVDQPSGRTLMIGPGVDARYRTAADDLTAEHKALLVEISGDIADLHRANTTLTESLVMVTEERNGFGMDISTLTGRLALRKKTIRDQRLALWLAGSYIAIRLVVDVVGLAGWLR